MVDPFTVESLVAVIGVEPFLSGKLARIHGYQVERAAAVPAEIERRLVRFLYRDDPEKTAELPDFDLPAVAALLVRVPTTADLTRIMGAFGGQHELAMAATGLVTRQRAILSAAVPKRVTPSIAGPIASPPPPSEVARFARGWALAQDPLAILSDLNEFAVSRDQVTSLSKLWPQLYARLTGSVRPAIARALAARPGWSLLRRKEALLRILLAEPALSAAVGQMMQAIYAQDAAPRPPKAASKAQPKNDSGDEGTSAQRVSAT